MTRWGMVVDLGRCVGCQTCTIACKMENGLPPHTLWRTVLDTESGVYPQVRRTFVPMTCMHCAEPPCYDACPTTATRVRDDGIVWIANEICIGCGSCVVACPYQARHLVPEESYYFGAATAPELATYDRSRVGICTKCHFCFHKFDAAPAGITPGVDPAYTPACSSSCIANAILFGDLDDAQSNVSRLIDGNGRGVRMLEHLETQPSVYYLNTPAIQSQTPRLQHSWHMLAVSNFFCGTTGFGLYVLGTLAAWWAGGSRPLLEVSDPIGSLASLVPTAPQLAGLLGPLLVIVGLLSVAAEAGRPTRGFNVFRNLRRSWMSRESAFAMGFVLLALLDTLLLASPALQALAMLAGLGVALSQGLVLAGAKGVPAWSVRLMPAHFVASGLVCGCGAWLVLAGLTGILTQPAYGLIVAALLVAFDLGLWLRYLATPARTPTFLRAVGVLKQWPWRLGIEGIGHVLPMLLLAMAFAASALAAPALATATVVLAGAAMLTGGLIAKVGLILKASFLVDVFDHFGAAPAATHRQPAAAKASSRALAA